MEKGHGNRQIPVERPVEIRRSEHEAHYGERVLQEAAAAGMVQFLGRGRGDESAPHLRIVEKGTEQAAQPGVRDIGEQRIEFGLHLV